MTVSPLANILEEVRALATTEPKTLAQAHEAFQAIAGLGLTKLREVASADFAAQITDAARNGVYGDNRSRTLPQAKEQLAALAALIPADCTRQIAAAPRRAESLGPKFEKGFGPWIGKAKSHPALATSTLKTDTLVYDQYESLKGHARFAFFQANRAALIRENARRTTAAATAVYGDLVAQYMSLTGQARSDFYAKHSRDLFDAHRTRSKHGG